MLVLIYIPINNRQSTIINHEGGGCRYFFVFKGKKRGSEGNFSRNIGKIKNKDLTLKPLMSRFGRTSVCLEPAAAA